MGLHDLTEIHGFLSILRFQPLIHVARIDAFTDIPPALARSRHLGVGLDNFNGLSRGTASV